VNILLVMIPLSILLALGAGIAFFWAVDHDQFDDLDTPSLLPLLDEPPAETASRADDDGKPEHDDTPPKSSSRRRPGSIGSENATIKINMDPGLRRDDDDAERRADAREEPHA